MFENRVLSTIFESKRDEVTGEWRKLHNEELNDQYCSPSIVRVIQPRRMRRAGHADSCSSLSKVHSQWWRLRRKIVFCS